MICNTKLGGYSIVAARWCMQQQDEVFKQAILIDRFNEFARLANEYLHINIAPLNEQGCCFALAQYFIKHARENTLEDFYSKISYITSEFSDKQLLTLLENAKPQRTPEQEVAFLAGNRSVKQPPIYNKFTLPKSDYDFEDIMRFAQGISQAQVGYKSAMAKSRFAKKMGQYGLGRFENIAGNWDNSYPIFGDKIAIREALEKLRLSDHHYAMIGSGNHAISFYKIESNRFLVYDSNDPHKSKILSSYADIANAIVEDFNKVGNLSSRGEVGIVIDTVSFSTGDLELKQALQQYTVSTQFSGLNTAVAQQCHDIIVSTETDQSLFDKAFAIYDLYTQQKEQGSVKSLEDFTHTLSPALQQVTRECLRYVQNAAFADSVETKNAITYQDKDLSTEQKIFMTKINEYYAQYHNGHLSRGDFSANVLRHIKQFMASPEATDFRSQRVYAEIMKLKNDLYTYSEGTVSVEELMGSVKKIDLNNRDNSGFSLTNHVLQSSPNKVTLQALFAQRKGRRVFRYRAEDRIDRATLGRLLSLSTTDAVEYIVTKIDLTKALTTPVPDSYELCLLSTLPNNDPKNAEKGKIYLSRKGDYYIRDPNGQVQKGSLPKSVINLNIFVMNLKHPRLVAAVHAEVNKRGFITTSLPLHEVIDSGNTEVIKYLLTTLPDMDINQKVPSSTGKAKTILEVALDFNSDSLAQLALQKGAQLTKPAAEALITQSLSGERELHSASRAALNQTSADEGQLPQSKYAFEQFQRTNTQEFEKANRWSAVVESIIEQSDPKRCETLFDAAISKGMLALAERLYLKNKKENPALENEHKRQEHALLIGATIVGDTAVVKRLVEQNKSLVNASYSESRSLLFKACESNHSELALFLVQEGAAVNDRVPSPLYYAAKAGDKKLVKRLMEKGAENDPKAEKDFRTPLMGIMEANVPIEIKAKLFRKIYSDVPLQEFSEATVHNAIINAVKSPSATLEDIKVFSKLFSVNLSDIVTKNLDSLAMVSLEAGNLELAKKFIKDTNLGPQYKNKNGETLLSIALKMIGDQEKYRRTLSDKYKPDLLAELVEQVKGWIEKESTLVKQIYGNGDSVLMRAIQSRNMDIVSDLIKNGANLNYLNPQTERTATHTAADIGEINVINRILKESPQLGIPDKGGKTPMLLYAYQRPTFEVIAGLKGENEELDDLDSQGNTLLHVAVKRGVKSRDFIKALLNEGLDPLQKNQAEEPKSALEIGLAEGNANIPGLLAICEHLSRDALVGDVNLLRQLEAHRESILAELKKELGATDRKNPEAVIEAVARIDKLVSMKNVAGELLKEKSNVPKSMTRLVAKLPVNLQARNQVFKELKSLKASFLRQEEPASSQSSRIKPSKFKNL